MLAGLLALAGCSALPERARTHLVGTALPDLLACVGRPDSRVRVGDDDWVLGFAPQVLAAPALSASVPVLGDALKPTVSVSNAESCRMIVRIRSGRVASVHYVGASFLLSGANGACAPLVRDCLIHPDHTALPAGYSADAVLSAREGQ